MVSIGQMDDGGMAEYFLAPAENCIPIPDDVPEDVVALIDTFLVRRGIQDTIQRVGRSQNLVAGVLTLGPGDVITLTVSGPSINSSAVAPCTGSPESASRIRAACERRRPASSRAR